MAFSCVNVIRFFMLIFGVLSSLNCAIGLRWIIIRGVYLSSFFFYVSIGGLSLVCFFSTTV
jgi:hypothetical protein